jgi:hypothetical protein
MLVRSCHPCAGASVATHDSPAKRLTANLSLSSWPPTILGSSSRPSFGADDASRYELDREAIEAAAQSALAAPNRLVTADVQPRVAA